MLTATVGVVDPHMYNTTASSSGARGLGGEGTTFAHVVLFGIGGVTLFALTHAFAYMRGEDAGRQQCRSRRRR